MKITYNNIMEDILKEIKDSECAKRTIKRIALGPTEIEDLKACLKKVGHEWRELPAQLFGVTVVDMEQELDILKDEL